MKKKVFCNWKMYLGVGETHTLASEIAERYSTCTGLALFPSVELISSVVPLVEGTDILVGAQDCAPQNTGAFTGSVSPENVMALGCHYVLVGHSERRTMGEGDVLFAKKFTAALAAGLTPVVCVGETQDDRDSGTAHAVIEHQLKAIVGDAPTNDYLVAYEPMWAIGTGRAATPDDAAEMCAFIKRTTGESMVLYGGSVEAKNIEAFAVQEQIDGFLVGSASISQEKLFPILDALRA